MKMMDKMKKMFKKIKKMISKKKLASLAIAIGLLAAIVCYPPLTA